MFVEEAIAYFRNSHPPTFVDCNAAFEAEILREAADYWHLKKGERTMPDRADIEPAEIRRLLAYVSLFEIEKKASGEVEVFPRLASRELERVIGPLQNKPLFQVLEPSTVLRWKMFAKLVIETEGPVRITGPVHHKGKHYITAETLLAPLTVGATDISMIFHAAVFTL